MTLHFRLIPLLVALVSLGACGGGDPPKAAPVVLNGTVLDTAPQGMAVVSARCTGATGSITTPSSGTYTLTLADAAYPCVVRAVGATGQVLHSVAVGTGSGPQTVNVSPLTELIVAKAAGTAPAAVYAAGPASVPAAARISEARTAIAAALKPLDIDITSDDPIKDADAASAGKLAKLLTLDTRLSSGKTSLAALAEVLVTTSGATMNQSVAAALTAPPVANCPAARNVVYRTVDSRGASRVTAPDFRTGVFAASERLTLSGDQPCEFQYTAGSVMARGQLAASGWWVHTLPTANGVNAAVVVGFPEQTLELADLKGSWNTVEIAREGSASPKNSYAVLDFDGAGNVKTSSCVGLAACTAGDALTIKSDPEGGFVMTTVSPAAPYTLKLYAYRAFDGRKTVAVVADGMMALGAPQAALTLPTVDRESRSLDMILSMAGSTLAATVSEGANRVTAVDFVARKFTRLQADGRIDEVVLDSPRAGLRHRPAGAFQGRPFAALIQLPLVEGVTAYGGIDAPRFGVSVSR